MSGPILPLIVLLEATNPLCGSPCSFHRPVSWWGWELNSALVDSTLHNKICKMPGMKHLLNVDFFPYLLCCSFLFHSLCSEQPLPSTGFRARRFPPPPQTLVSHPHFLLINFHNFHSKYCLYIFNKSVLSIYINHRMIYFLSVWLTLQVDLH